MKEFNKATESVISEHGGLFPKEFPCPRCGQTACTSQEFYDWPENKKWLCDFCGCQGTYWAAYQYQKELKISVEPPDADFVPPIAEPHKSPERPILKQDFHKHKHQ